MTGPRQTYSVDQIKDMLLAQVETVVHHYAPPSPDGWQLHGKYFTTNPGRADRHAGSFWIQMTGPRAGYWRDHATGQFGDIIDLIGLAHGMSNKDAIREARNFLGLATLNPADIARRKEAAELAKRRRREAAQKERERRDRRAGAARAIWHEGQAQLRNTPVDFYLRDARGIDLGELKRTPGVLRFVPRCRYYHVDRHGEIHEGTYPAMVAAITNRRGQMVACHRTYLAQRSDGRWDKAPVPKPRLVLGDYAGAYIPIWKGVGPRGGKPASLHQAEPGQHVFLSEGIEDALSAVLLLEGRPRVLTSISVSNWVQLPDTVSKVTMIADADWGEEARACLARAIQLHRDAGRDVRAWFNNYGGKDLNDALKAARAAEEGQQDDRTGDRAAG
jgi:hypothetical protein